MKYTSIDKKLFVENRKKFVSQLQPNSIAFFNSNDERSHYAAYHWRPLGWNPAGVSVRAGLAFGAMDGYSNTNNGHWFPIVLPVLSAEYGHLGANLVFAPHPRNGAALALQLRLRVW